MIWCINSIIIIIVILVIFCLHKKKFRWFNKEKSIIENLSQLVIILTLGYGLFQYSHYIYPVWEKQHKLESLETEIKAINVSLSDKHKSLVSINKELDEVKEQKKVIEEKNQKYEKIILEKQTELEEIIANLNIAKADKINAEEELYESYCYFFIQQVFNDYLRSIKYGDKSKYNFKEKIVQYCTLELQSSENKTLRIKALNDFISFAKEQMNEGDDFKPMYNFLYSKKRKI